MRVAPRQKGWFSCPEGKTSRGKHSTLGHTEQEPIACSRPGHRNVGRTLLGPGEALGCSGAIGALPEDAEVAFPVRLKGDALAIR